jgi:hypothetical protein
LEGQGQVRISGFATTLLGCGDFLGEDLFSVGSILAFLSALVLAAQLATTLSRLLRDGVRFSDAVRFLDDKLEDFVVLLLPDRMIVALSAPAVA